MSIITKIFSGGAGELVESVGGVLDNLTTSKEEKLAAKQKMKERIADYATKMEQNITDRWKADMNSDSWLSKNVRPLVLIFLVVCTVLMIFIDAGSINFVVEQKWTDLLQLVLITVIGAYFGGRSFEKRQKKQYNFYIHIYLYIGYIMAKNTIKEALVKEYIRCSQDPVYFMRKYCFIQHPQRGKIKFDLFPFQEDSLIDLKKNRFNIILKSRQMGISTLTAGYAVWNMIFREDFNVLVIAIKQDTA